MFIADRRQFLLAGAAAACGIATPLSDALADDTPIPDGFRPLFDGKTLKGWHPTPRLLHPPYPGSPYTPISPDSKQYKAAAESLGKWEVKDGTIVAGQSILNRGAYLVSKEKFGNFELLVDVRPDWPIDTGFLVRGARTGKPGYQILMDHRPGGGIGGFYGNNLAGFHGLPFIIDAKHNKDGKIIGLQPGDPTAPNSEYTKEKRELLSYAADVEEFLEVWNFDEWNTFKVRCVGKYPRLTTWINGVKIAELDTATMSWPNFDKDAVLEILGERGHIALEVHGSNLRDPVGQQRWWPGAVCRWRNVMIKELQG